MTNKNNYNILALRGANVDDMEYIETFGLNPELAYTPGLNEAMLDMAYQQNIDAGVPEEKAQATRNRESQNIKRLLAKNGMLKVK